jgi:hypothetical protein
MKQSNSAKPARHLLPVQFMVSRYGTLFENMRIAAQEKTV